MDKIGIVLNKIRIEERNPTNPGFVTIVCPVDRTLARSTGDTETCERIGLS